jgi:hypothetical protein
LTLGRLGIPPPDPLLPSRPRFVERAGDYLQRRNNLVSF